jgi:zinc/manganese transport system substrate-binding protein
MRRKVFLVPLILFLLPVVSSRVALDVHAQVTPVGSIAVSVPSLAAIVQGIGGAIYNTTVLVRQESDPHAFSVSPETIAIAEAADLLVFTGHFFWEEELANLTSTPFITFHDANALENYEDFGAEYSPMPGTDTGVGGHDSQGNPHGFWLLPKNALAVANATRAALTTLDAAFSSDLTSNFENFEQSTYQLQGLIDALDNENGFSGMKAVDVSPAEAYVAEAFGITSVAVLQVEDITISGQKLLEVENAIRNGSIQLIIGSDLAQLEAGGEFAYQLQEDYGGILIWWKTVFFAESDYFSMMGYNLGALVSGLEGRSGHITTSVLNIWLLAIVGILGVVATVESALLIVRARAEP